MQTIDFERLKITCQDTVLDLGCGEGRHAIFAHYFTSAQHVFALDINQQDITLAKQKDTEFDAGGVSTPCLYLVGDALRLPFADASFSVVICSEVLEHLPEYKAALQEINRVLKPDGRLAISVPRTWPEQICWWLSSAYHQVEGGHVRIFKTNELRQEIVNNGFGYQEKHWAHALHSPYWWLKCLFWTSQDQSKVILLYHKILVWDLLKKPRLTRLLEKILNPIMGKSVVMYFQKYKN